MITIVTAGKGGTGKSTTISHLLKRHILGKGFGPVLVVDADPHQSLTHHLGVMPEKTLGELRHTHKSELKSGQGLENMSRQAFARLLAEQAITPIEGGDLLVMGRNDEPGCQCVVNTILGRALDAVASKYALVVVDNEAGIEPIGRHAWPVDHLMLFSSPKGTELDVAWQILDRASESNRWIGSTYLVLNRAHEGQDLRLVSADQRVTSTTVLGTLPYSEKLDWEERPDEAWLAALDHVWAYVHGRIKLKERIAQWK
jgi:CO dehydrogenase maturation factor